MSPIDKRYEFVLLFEVTNGNPNGDPDAGNMPRLDPETNLGLVSDVSLKRKVRNYVSFAKESTTPAADLPLEKLPQRFEIFVTERAILDQKQRRAWTANAIQPDKGNDFGKLPKDDADARKLSDWMCANFYDVRTFGAVMSTKGANCGQVRGPVQFAFGRSVEPIVPQEISITRMAATTEDETKGDIRTMGRKHIVPDGLYRAHGFVSAKLAERTGFSQADLDLLWEALGNMFEHDRSAARGELATRALIVFEHDCALGRANAHELFDRVTVDRVVDGEVRRLDDKGIGNASPARRFADYHVAVNTEGLPEGITVRRLV